MFKIDFKFVVMVLGAFLMISCSDDDGGGSAPADSDLDDSTYTLSGNLDNGSSASSLSTSSFTSAFAKLVGTKSTERSQCGDGFFYSVYCLSFSEDPVAAEGNVDCSGGGAFEVEGLPVGEAIGCFIRRYESATAPAAEASTVGAIQIPASNLTGTTEQVVSNGDVALDVTIGSDGTISAQVVSGGENLNENTDNSSNFTATAMNGIWNLSCDSAAGGDQFSAGRCKCFLGDRDSAYQGPNSEQQCLADNGAAISGSVNLGIEINLYSADLISDLTLEHGAILSAGSTVHAISIWGVSGNVGNYVSLRGSGGDELGSMGGLLAWNTSTPSPTAPLAWATSLSAEDGKQNNITGITVGTVPSATADHGTWMTWVQALVDSAQTQGWECNRGPDDSYAVEGNSGSAPFGDLEKNVDCINEVLERVSEGQNVVMPRVHLRPFCDHNGCYVSSDNTATVGDGAQPYYHANALAFARLEVEGVNFQFPQTWALTDDNTAVTADPSRSIGIDPESRYALEALEFFPGGAGFRQSDHDSRHYYCGDTGSGADVESSHCAGSGFYELRCFGRSELSLKFLGTTSPMTVVFDQVDNIGFAELVHHDMGNGPQQVADAPAMELCIEASGGGGGVFFATGTKQ